jgi:hypothetical protein
MYVMVYSVSKNWDLPENFRLDNFPGLLTCRTIGAESQKYLQCEWINYEIYLRCSGKELEQHLQLEVSICSGYELRKIMDPVPWWQRTPAAIMLAAGLTGAVVGLGTNLIQLDTVFAELFAAPSAILVPIDESSNVIAGERGELRFNMVSATKCRSELTVLDIETPDIETLEFIKPFPGCAASYSSPGVLAVPFVAKNSGEFTIHIKYRVKAGKFVRAKENRVTLTNVFGWPRIQETFEPKLAQAATRGAFYVFDARHGSPPRNRDIKYSAEIVQRGVYFDDVEPGEKVNSFSDGDISIIEWTHKATALNPERFTLRLKNETNEGTNIWSHVHPKIYIDYY